MGCQTDLQRRHNIIRLDGSRVEARSAEQLIHHMEVG
jgi:hypothetical protein